MYNMVLSQYPSYVVLDAVIANCIRASFTLAEYDKVTRQQTAPRESPGWRRYQQLSWQDEGLKQLGCLMHDIICEAI